jgi:hypothetical protein
MVDSLDYLQSVSLLAFGASPQPVAHSRGQSALRRHSSAVREMVVVRSLTSVVGFSLLVRSGKVA